MMEKKVGSHLVSKLRSILLLEADMNKANKIIYGERMMNNIRRYQLMPEEIFSEKNRTADDGALAKILFFDIGRQLRTPSAIASVDASNCYDRIAHAIASLVFQAFGVDQSAAVSMLSTIQEMSYFLRTAYGDSTNCAKSTVEVKYQGLCQGSGAAPAGWAAISVTILMAHKANGHGATFACPITPDKAMDLAAILFVDDTDIIHINMNRRESMHDVHAALAASVKSWNSLLLATGGALHPDKCFYYLMSYRFDKRRKVWLYEDHTDDERYDIAITLPDGTPSLIAQHHVDHAETMLGVRTSPSGSSDGCMEVMKEKATDCVQKVLSSRINRRQFWTWISACFWPKISYGLCCNMATIPRLQACLGKTYYQLLPVGGIIRSAPTDIRDLDLGFFGCGLPNVAIECGVHQLNKLLMHYGCSSSVGTQLQSSMELFMIELGRSHQPFLESFQRYHQWVTDSWVKSIWEKVACSGYKVLLNNIELPFPRDGDEWIMNLFEDCGYSPKELLQLNRVRIHQQVLFLTDVLCVKGKSIDPKYKKLRPDDERWSRLIFPYEEPNRSDLKLWNEALRQVAPRGHPSRRLGNWNHAGHKMLQWRYCEDSNTLFRYHGDNLMDVYPRAVLAPYHNNPRRYSKYGSDRERIHYGNACTVEEVATAVYRMVSFATLPAPPTPPTTLSEVLEQWGSMWMWDEMELTGSFEFLLEAIAAGSLDCVADGSFIKEKYPDLCSAAFILECSQGRGRVIGKFSEQTIAACAYRGELLGLLAIHLILLALNKLSPEIQGSVHIYSDCLGALRSVQHLPPHRIPSGCRHSDILKTIMLHCQKLSFGRLFSHVSAHKLDHFRWEELTRPEQLNEQCDSGAKQAIYDFDPDEGGQTQPLPLEPICVFVDDKKMTSDTGECIRFHGHRTLAKGIFSKRHILLPDAFEQVDWSNVYKALHHVPRLFALFVCKQVMDIAGTNSRLSKHEPSRSPLCPSCLDCIETCGHVLTCEQEDRVKCFQMSADNLEKWLRSVGTDPTLEECIMAFVRSRDAKSFSQCVAGQNDPVLTKMARSQDKIGWRRFMEGMISKELCRMQTTYTYIDAYALPADKWARGLSIKLMEMTHSQWLVRNFLIHDNISGMLALERKEDLQIAIEEQQEMGCEGLEEEDMYLMEINLDDLETTCGETQAYWLLAVKAARKAHSVRRRQAARRSRQQNHG